MNTVLDRKDIINDLNDLIELEYDAIAAYESAVNRLDTPSYRKKIHEFLSDHESHLSTLTHLVRKEGGEAKDSGNAKKILTKGKVVLADLGGDEAILKAMKSNEDQTNSKYEEAVEKIYPAHIMPALQEALADERRHRSWVETTISAM